MLDQQGLIIRANPQLAIVSGYSNDEIFCMSALSFFEGVDKDSVKQSIQEVFEKGNSSVEVELLTKSGQKISYYLTGHLTLIDDLPYIVGLGTDISARKRAEKALRESENRFKAISENQIVGIVISKNRTIQWANPAYEKILGYDKGELTGLPTKFIFYSDDEYRTLGEKAYTIMNAGGIYHSEVTYKRKDGSPIFVEVSGGSLNKETGETIWSCVDVTERVKNEQELKRSNQELEQFSYAISHDMRQPLRMVGSFLQLLQKNIGESLVQENREYFDFAIEGAQRMDQMLLGMLEYSRVGRINDPFAMVESREILDEAILFLGPEINEARANIMIEGVWPQVMVSRDEVVRLVQNLIGNAVKYRVPDRTPQIRIRSEIGSDVWRLSVSDNGVGIDPAQIGRLFQVFQRLQSRTNFKGSGIGLALCRRIVEHHSGRIWAESRGENQGSTFSFELKQEQTS